MASRHWEWILLSKAWIHVETHTKALKLICAEVVPNLTTPPHVLLELPHLQPWACERKKEGKANTQILKICKDGNYYCTLVLYIVMCCGSNWPIIQQMAHWQGTVCGMRGKFHQVRRGRLHSWLLSAGLEKVLNLHALIWLNWNSSPLTRLCSYYNLSM